MDGELIDADPTVAAPDAVCARHGDVDFGAQRQIPRRGHRPAGSDSALDVRLAGALSGQSGATGVEGSLRLESVGRADREFSRRVVQHAVQLARARDFDGGDFCDADLFGLCVSADGEGIRRCGLKGSPRHRKAGFLTAS